MLSRAHKAYNLVFIGFQATGKTTIGKALHKKLLNFSLYDVDDLIEIMFSRTIYSFINHYGILYFRWIESHIYHFLLLKNYRKIITTGGGIILSQKNRDLTKKYGFAILLESDIQDSLYRIQNSKKQRFRFMKNCSLVQELKNLLEKRNFYYHSMKDYTYNTSQDSVKILIQDILDRFILKPVKKNETASISF